MQISTYRVKLKDKLWKQILCIKQKNLGRVLIIKAKTKEKYISFNIVFELNKM